MSIRERIPHLHIAIDDEGEILPDEGEGPASNDYRIARMHPHRKFNDEADAEQPATVSDMSAQPQEEVILSEDEQDLMEALEAQSHEVSRLIKKRETYREELARLGVGEVRIRQKLAKKFGRAVVDLAKRGYDVEPIIGPEQPEHDQADISELPVTRQEPGKIQDSEYIRERDVKERQAGPDN